MVPGTTRLVLGWVAVVSAAAMAAGVAASCWWWLRWDEGGSVDGASVFLHRGCLVWDGVKPWAFNDDMGRWRPEPGRLALRRGGGGPVLWNAKLGYEAAGYRGTVWSLGPFGEVWRSEPAIGDAGIVVAWPGPLVTGAVGVWFVRSGLRARRASRVGLWRACGYDLSGIPEGAGRLCPECGSGEGGRA